MWKKRQRFCWATRLFDYLKGNDKIRSFGPWSDADIQNAQEKLGQTAPDFIEFVRTFGSADIHRGFFHFYSGIADLNEHLEGMELPAIKLDAWIFGDGDGDMGVIDKTTGECLQIDHEGYEIYSRHNTFTDFINWILKE